MRILEPIRVGNLKLRNRIVMPPMNTELATTEGSVTQELIDHYAERAPWLGMIVIEHSYVSGNGRLSPQQLGVHEDRLIDGLTNLAAAVKREGTPVALQINHAGMRCDGKLIGRTPVGPSKAPDCEELTTDEIHDIVEAFGRAAARAIASGFDAVEIHGAHGFLLCQFASPITNRRLDAYGGDLEGRLRLPIEIVRRVREELGPDTQLWYRLGADDRREGGNTVEEGARMGKMLVAEGVDVLDVSGGIAGSRPADAHGPGYYAYAAKAVREVTGVPVIAVGGITTPPEAEDVLSRWGVDLVAVGRALLKDPTWAKAAYDLGAMK